MSDAAPGAGAPENGNYLPSPTAAYTPSARCASEAASHALTNSFASPPRGDYLCQDNFTGLWAFVSSTDIASSSANQTPTAPGAPPVLTVTHLAVRHTEDEKMVSVVIRTRGRREKRSPEAAVSLDGKKYPLGGGIEGFTRGTTLGPGHVELLSESRGTRLVETRVISRDGDRVLMTIEKTATSLVTQEVLQKWTEVYDKIEQDPAAPTPSRANGASADDDGSDSDEDVEALVATLNGSGDDDDAVATVDDNTDLPISRLVMLQAMLRRLPQEERQAFASFAAALASVVNSSYAVLRESAKQSGNDQQKFAAFLKLAAAAQYTPIDDATWANHIAKRSKTEKRLHPNLDLPSSETLTAHYAGSPYHWGATADPRARASKAAPHFADKVAVLVRGAGMQVPRDIAPLKGIVALVHSYLSASHVVEVETESAYKDVIVAYFAKADEDGASTAVAGKPQATAAGAKRKAAKGKSAAGQQQQSFHVEIYRNVPQSDLVLTLPARGVTLSVLDVLTVAAEAVPMLIAMWLGAQGLFHEGLNLYSLTAVAVVVGCIAKLAAIAVSVMTQLETLNGMLDGWKSAHRDAVESDALDRLSAQVVEQEAKEALLAYFILWQAQKAGQPITNADALSTAAQDFLVSLRLKTKSLETDDALHKLEALGLVDGGLRIRETPKGFLQRKQERWDALLRSQFNDIMDARVR